MEWKEFEKRRREQDRLASFSERRSEWKTEKKNKKMNDDENEDRYPSPTPSTFWFWDLAPYMLC